MCVRDITVLLNVRSKGERRREMANTYGYNGERYRRSFKMTAKLSEKFAECGITTELPHENVIPQETLKKLIDSLGIKNTLRWINGEEITDEHLARTRES